MRKLRKVVKMKPNKADLKFTSLYQAELPDKAIYKKHKKDINRYNRHIENNRKEKNNE